jgi:hypothetical protein
VAKPPEFLTLERHRDLQGRERTPYVRWALLTAIAIVVALGLVNAFGQRPHTGVARSGGVELEVYSPESVRAGLYYMSRFTIRAEQELEKATLVLDSGWVEGLTINTVAPSPLGEASRDGRIAYELGHVRAGTAYVLYVHSQVNPTNVGRRSQDVDLLDGTTPLLHLDRTIRIWP